MKFTVQPNDATLGAIITGVDLADLDDITWHRVEAAFNQYAVLIFPGQNLVADGTLLEDYEHGMQVLVGNEGWHTDSSYMQLSAKASVLSAHVVPCAGGETEWELRLLVKIHPVTGRPALYMRHAYGIAGLDPSESEQLLDELVAFACQPPRTYKHSWQPGDIVVWDNRCVLHRARPYDHSELAMSG